MGSFKRPRAFDPLDLEIIDRVYEAVWARIEAREPDRDRERDEEVQQTLRERIFAVAGIGRVEFDELYERVLTWHSDAERLPSPADPRYTSID